MTMEKDLVSRNRLVRSFQREDAVTIDGHGYFRADAVLEKLRMAPAVDAVPVVRCGECDAWNNGLCRLLCADTLEDGYCHWACRTADGGADK